MFDLAVFAQSLPTDDDIRQNMLNIVREAQYIPEIAGLYNGAKSDVVKLLARVTVMLADDMEVR